MSAKDRPVSMPSNDAYRDGWDRLWGGRRIKTFTEGFMAQQGRACPTCGAKWGDNCDDAVHDAEEKP